MPAKPSQPVRGARAVNALQGRSIIATPTEPLSSVQGMARFPIPTPAWYDRPYASYGDAWWEACDQASRTLHHWASERRYGTYTELCRSVTAIPWDPVEGPYTHGGQQVGMLLGQISLSELAGSAVSAHEKCRSPAREKCRGLRQVQLTLAAPPLPVAGVSW